MPPTQSRRSYTAVFKLEVAIYAEENGGNMAAQRKYLAIHQRTTLAQQLPADHVEKLQSFCTFVQKQIAENKIPNDNIINMDEVPLTFDIPMNRTVEQKGTSSITIRTTGHEKSSFTVVLACAASGRKLPPMMIFKRKTAIWYYSAQQ